MSLRYLPLFLLLSACATSRSLVLFQNPDGSCGYKDARGNVVVEAGIYKDLPKDIAGAAVVQSAKTPNKWYLLNAEGESVAQVYSKSTCFGFYHEDFSSNRIRIVSDGLIGYADDNADVVVKPVYTDALPYEGNYAVVSKSLLNQDTSTDNAEASSSTDEMLYGLIDLNGNVVRDFKYKREWNTNHNTFVYTSASDSFMILKGKLVPVKK